MRLRLDALPLARRSGICGGLRQAKSGDPVIPPPSFREQTAAETSLRRIFVLPLNGMLHTVLDLRQRNCLSG